jgi:hypothetical protein
MYSACMNRENVRPVEDNSRVPRVGEVTGAISKCREEAGRI